VNERTRKSSYFPGVAMILSKTKTGVADIDSNLTPRKRMRVDPLDGV
jgi:hypothetical protein